MGPPAGGRTSSGSSRATSHAVPLEQVVQDICAMGFQRHQVMAVVNRMQNDGQAIDLNVIIDRLTRGGY